MEVGVASGHSIGQGEREGFRTRELASRAGLRACFVPEAGMVCASLDDRGAELLGQRGGLAAYVREGTSFGIPLLHPWANRLSRRGLAFGDVRVDWPERASGVRVDANGLPIHGLLAGAPDWRVRAHRVEAGCARLAAELDFAADPVRAALFPFPHVLEVEATLADRTLRIATTLRATGGRPVPVAFGWHPWLRLPDLPRAAWRVTLPVERRLCLDARCLPSGAHEPCAIPPGPLGERRYDDLFDRLAPGRPFVLEGGGRRIELAFEAGYELAVVYAPARDAVVCFEPMTAPTDPFEGGFPLQSVAPGERFTAAFTLTVIPTEPI